MISKAPRFIKALWTTRKSLRIAALSIAHPQHSKKQHYYAVAAFTLGHLPFDEPTVAR
jgi:hypothetical protein